MKREASLGQSCPVLGEAGGGSAGKKLPDRLKTPGGWVTRVSYIFTGSPFKKKGNILSPKGRLEGAQEGNICLLAVLSDKMNPEISVIPRALFLTCSENAKHL